MTLKSYLERKKLTQAQFAAKIGRDRSTISRLMNGETRPEWDTVLAIYKATDGAVTPNDFIQNEGEAA